MITKGEITDRDIIDLRGDDPMSLLPQVQSGYVRVSVTVWQQPWDRKYLYRIVDEEMAGLGWQRKHLEPLSN